MSAAPSHPRERTILDTRGLSVKGQEYHAVLTDTRIILTGTADQTPRTILLQEVWRIGSETDPSGDPVLVLSIPAAGGMVHTVILHFPLARFPNALRLRDLWASELGRLIQSPVPAHLPAAAAPAFCPRCGNRLAGGSVFCDRCGAPATGPGGSSAPVSSPVPVHAGTLRKKKAPLNATEPSGRPVVSAAAPVRSGKRPKKTVTIFGGVLVIVIIIAVVVMSGLFSDNQKSGTAPSGRQVSLPLVGTVRIPEIPVIPAGSDSDTGSPSGIAGNAPDSGSAPASGDPETVFMTYKSLYNKGDGAGLEALLSDNMKSHYSAEMLDTELASAHKSGYSIEAIRIIDQEIDEGSATLSADITWKNGISTTTTSPEIFLVYEHDVWKLDSLEFRP